MAQATNKEQLDQRKVKQIRAAVGRDGQNKAAARFSGSAEFREATAQRKKAQAAGQRHHARLSAEGAGNMTAPKTPTAGHRTPPQAPQTAKGQGQQRLAQARRAQEQSRQQAQARAKTKQQGQAHAAGM